MTVTLTSPTQGTLSPGNLQFNYYGNNNLGGALATQGFSSGKWYFEFKATFASAYDGTYGGMGDTVGDLYSTNLKAVGLAGGNIGFNGSTLGNYTYSGAVASGDWLAMAIDLTNLLIWGIDLTNGYPWNNNGSANPATGTGGYSLAGATNLPWYPGTAWYSGTADTSLFNFGATTFQGTVPAGFTPVGGIMTPPTLAVPRRVFLRR
jgi:hypothetical protein